MNDDVIRVRAGGTWLATASVVMAIVLVVHGPIAAELSDQMVRIAHHPLRWSVAHWLAAAGLSFYAVAALLVLTSRTALVEGPSMLSAWAVVLLGGLWTLSTALAEATVIRDAATSGNADAFEAWWAYAEGNAHGFAVLALGLAVIAASDARQASGATPTWAAWTGTIAGIGAFSGWALGMWFEVPVGNVLWVLASILMAAWSAWFGVALAGYEATSTGRR